MVLCMRASAFARDYRWTVIDGRAVGNQLNQFFFVGHWVIVRGRNDGRLNGTSARSMVPGDFLYLGFKGIRLKVYGVLGPGGGIGILTLTNNVGQYTKELNFYAPQKRTRALMYISPELSEGQIHALTIKVSDQQPAPHRAYVNVNYVEVEN